MSESRSVHDSEFESSGEYAKNAVLVLDPEMMCKRLDSAEYENSKLRFECGRALSVVENIQQRLADVESDHKRLVDSNAVLQHRLDEHQVDLEQSKQHCIENEAHWQMASVKM